jgi:hypothetical protein
MTASHSSIRSNPHSADSDINQPDQDEGYCQTKCTRRQNESSNPEEEKDHPDLDKEQLEKRQRNNIYTQRFRKKKRDYTEKLKEDIRKGRAENRVLMQRLEVLQVQLEQREEVKRGVLKRILEMERSMRRYQLTMMMVSNSNSCVNL